MSVVKLNTAKDLRRSDNAQSHIFWKLQKSPLVGFPEDSEFTYKTVPIGVISPVGACAVLTHVARKPLRRIVARTPESFEKAPGYILTHYIDTLECGHQIVTYSGEESKRKRGCQECLDAQIAAKKPVQSTRKKVA